MFIALFSTWEEFQAEVDDHDWDFTDSASPKVASVCSCLNPLWVSHLKRQAETVLDEEFEAYADEAPADLEWVESTDVCGRHIYSLSRTSDLKRKGARAHCYARLVISEVEEWK